MYNTKSCLKKPIICQFRPRLQRWLLLLTIIASSLAICIIKSNRSCLQSCINTVHVDEQSTTLGDCQAIGPRRPVWDNRVKMVSSLPKFSEIYDSRPFRENNGGMRYHHSFGLWYMLQEIYPKPTVVIESGAKRGHSTWVIRQALPDVKIITISPQTPQFLVDNVIYLTGKRFKDFAKVDWSQYNVDTSKAIIVFDDHQSAYRRIFKEAIPMGYNRFIFDDNCEFQQCDALSMKWLCETKRKGKWMGYIRDNFGKEKQEQSWNEHLAQAKDLDQVKYYYEFPPVIGKRRGPDPLIQDPSNFMHLVGEVGKNESEFKSYAYICYVEL